MTRTGASAIAEARARAKPGARGRIQRSAPERRTYNGRVYASLAECAYARELDLLVEARKITRWEPQVRFPLYAAAPTWGPEATPFVSVVCKYVADFLVYFPDHNEIHEVKARGGGGGGYRDPKGALKVKWFRACYPGLVVREIIR